MTASARARSAWKSARSAGPPSGPERPLTAIRPSTLAIMFRARRSSVIALLAPAAQRLIGGDQLTAGAFGDQAAEAGRFRSDPAHSASGSNFNAAELMQ